PLEGGHPLGEAWIGDKQAWQHFVYMGVYPLEAAFAELREALADTGEGEDNDPLPAGESALAVFAVADDGRAILGSQTLASCAWAICRAASRGSPSGGWLDGFEDSARKFKEGFEELVDLAEDDEEAQEVDEEGHSLGCVLDRSLLEEIRELALKLVGADGPGRSDAIRDALQIRVWSRRVGLAGRYRPASHDFINSFIAHDLKQVADAVGKGDHGPALRRYLASTGEVEAEKVELGRTDVEEAPDCVRRLLAPELVPSGRWPSEAAHPASMGQQLAVNAILDRDLVRSRLGGLLGVNGPPGTGKTTLLRELIAATVVGRAERLAELKRPEQAFRATPHKFRAGTWERTVHQLKRQFTGFEMVLACATNAAAANVSNEIPLLDAIATDWRGRVDYFADIATNMLDSKRPAGGERFTAAAQPEAWAMVAACLGSKAKCNAFTNAFWWGQRAADTATGDTDRDKATDAQHGLQHILKHCKAAPGDWADAVRDFRSVQERVTAAREERHAYARLFGERDSSMSDADEHAARTRETASSLRDAELARDRCQQAVSRCRRERERIAHEHKRHRAVRPRPLEVLLSFGAAKREWRARDYEIADQLSRAEQALAHAEEQQQQATTDIVLTAERLAQHERAERDAKAHAERLQAQIADAAAQWDTLFPGCTFPDWQWAQASDRERRELRAPWIDEQWDSLRTELFLAALRLHKAFILANAAKLRQSLTVAVEVISDKSPTSIPRKAALAAWQCLFLLVPVVSTTFASFPRLFRHLGREEIGWLFIDEAGQSTPQNAAGPIWRSKHAVVVGDPLQLEPIVGLPLRTQHDLQRAHGVDDRWLPSNCSVQTLADRVTLVGTYRGSEGDIWVGFPLNVHRRCEEPMFGIVNEIAYDNQMIDHTPLRPELSLPPSAWLDVAGGHSEGHWIPEEGELLDRLLSQLGTTGSVEFEQVFIITPFRDIANRLAGYRKAYPGITAGTVHTAQGKEADVVILVLGGYPHRTGDKEWAAAKPNLLNVAVSRAKRRLYVIGNQAAWAGQRYFDVLAERLPADAENVSAAGSGLQRFLG
ncbi:MAG: DEAD/DEAH box helicase, partial [Solirubrobacteraceae bacterium]